MNIKNFVNIQILIAISIQICKSQLKIFEGPDYFKKHYKNGINYKQAINFGHFQQGKELIGNLVISNPLDGCGNQNITEGEKNQSQKSFLIVMRGNCTFVTKCRFAQLQGFQLVIVVNSQEDEQEGEMGDDGHGYYNVDIPAISITKRDGEELLRDMEYINEVNKKNQNSSLITPLISNFRIPIVLSVKFETHIQQNITINFYITSVNRQSFKLVRDFQQNYKELKESYNNIKFEPIYGLWECQRCKQQNFTKQYLPNCISAGRYCAYGLTSTTSHGRHYVLQDLLQICLFKQDQQKWWNYMDQFDQECIDAEEYESCSDIIMSRISIDTQQVHNCIRNSFIVNNNNYDIDFNDNHILRHHLKKQNKHNLQFVPSVYINNYLYRGNLNPAYILESICANLNSTDVKVCNTKRQKQVNAFIQTHSYTSYFFIIILCCFILLLAFFCYRRSMLKSMNSQVKSEVHQLVNSYLQQQINQKKSEYQLEQEKL